MPATRIRKPKRCVAQSIDEAAIAAILGRSTMERLRKRAEADGVGIIPAYHAMVNWSMGR